MSNRFSPHMLERLQKASVLAGRMNHAKSRGRTDAGAVLEAADLEWEITLPAGTCIKVGGRDFILAAPVAARSPDPIHAIEGHMAAGSVVDQAWPLSVEMARLAEAPKRDTGRAMMVDYGDPFGGF